MTSSLTINFSNSPSQNLSVPVLKAYFLPEIILDEEYDYSCALLDLIIQTKVENDLKKLAELDVLRVNCDVISGSYINGEQQHTIHQFATSASYIKGRILVEIPKNLTYFPIKLRSLRSIQISIVDHKENLINIESGNVNIFCRINIRRDF